MKITAVVAQFPVSLSIRNNLEIIDSILAQTNPGDLVVLPEGAVSGYSTDISFLKQIHHLELVAGLAHLQKEAENRKIHLWVGACIHIAGQWFNAAYGFSPDGKPQVYHKINLATHERGFLTAGSDLPVFELTTAGASPSPEPRAPRAASAQGGVGVGGTGASPSPWGTANLQVGVQICRELRFPEQWGWLARRGAQIFLHLNNAIDNPTLQPVWRSHLVSRAAETQRFVLSANTAAPRQSCPTLVIAPNGQVLAEMVSAETGLLRLELDLSQTSAVYLDQSRTDLVAIQSTRPDSADHKGNMKVSRILPQGAKSSKSFYFLPLPFRESFVVWRRKPPNPKKRPTP